MILVSFLPVLANPAMQWSKQGQPQNTDTKTIIKVSTLAGCSVDVASKNCKRHVKIVVEKDHNKKGRFGQVFVRFF
jgi:hypothetical protein